MATGKQKAEAIRHAIDTKLCPDFIQGGALTILMALLEAGTWDTLTEEDRDLLREGTNLEGVAFANNSAERQAIRFMYADFVAYMLESEDEEDIGAKDHQYEMSTLHG